MYLGFLAWVSLDLALSGDIFEATRYGNEDLNLVLCPDLPVSN